MTHSLPLIPANHWNRTAAELARKLGLIFRGRSAGKGYRLPWEISVVWNPLFAEWEASVHPGFVNAMETETPALAWDRAPAATRVRLAAEAGKRVRPWITEGAWFPLPLANFRRLGYDADPVRDPETVPEYFAALGVGAPPRLDLDPGRETFAIVQAGELAASRRLLRAIDVVLTIPKPSVAVVVTASPTGEGADLDLTLSTPAAGSLCSIFTSRAWQPPAEVGSLAEGLASGIADPAYVERRIGTVFFMSPPGAAFGSDPDSTWTPVVRQDLNYNRVLAYRTELSNLPRLALRVTTGLAGGLADPIFANLLAPVNEADQVAALSLSRASVRVEEWSL